jgi:BirA family biotin operon repressor/biotin-[acetyl-CoA-carboxylase] ligase
MTEFPRSAGGFPVVAFETIGSTNAEGGDRLKAGEAGPLWIVARRQTAGHGRRGRPWVSEAGNLYASLLLSDTGVATALPQLCFVAAVALHDALLAVTDGLAPAQIKLKWPNDVLLDGRKLAGILLEGTSAPGSLPAVVIGFGVNCRRHPATSEFPATDLAAAGHAVTPETLLGALGEAMAARLDQWRGGKGFAATRTAWLARAAGIGEPIEVRLADRTIVGIFETLEPGGALILRRQDGARETIAAGDVFPLTRAA